MLLVTLRGLMGSRLVEDCTPFSSATFLSQFMPAGRRTVQVLPYGSAGSGNNKSSSPLYVRGFADLGVLLAERLAIRQRRQAGGGDLEVRRVCSLLVL